MQVQVDFGERERALYDKSFDIFQNAVKKGYVQDEEECFKLAVAIRFIIDIPLGKLEESELEELEDVDEYFDLTVSLLQKIGSLINSNYEYPRNVSTVFAEVVYGGKIGNALYETLKDQ